MRSVLTCLLAASVLFATSVAAADDVVLLRERSAAMRPQLLLIGTAHFDNPGRDVINDDVEDLASPRRQAEFEALVDRLASFAPTKIAVEWPAADQDGLDARYRAYRSGERPLGLSETDQLGLRLAARLGLPRVHAVDWNGYPPGELARYDWDEWANANGQQARLAAIRDPQRGRRSHALGDDTISGWLQRQNRPEARAHMHRAYFDYALLGDGDEHPGANWLGHWYARNMRIFANLVRLADAPDDRVLVVYGSGHAYLLDRFVQESGAFSSTSLDDVLAAPGNAGRE